jgi:hypothetical protein
MFKEAFICGLGMVVDLYGSYYSQTGPGLSQDQRIAHYWKSVGDNLQVSVDSERPKVEEAKRRQLQLNLGA